MISDMPEKFGEPWPRCAPNIYEPHNWKRGDVTALEPARPELSIDLPQVLKDRQTRRVFNTLRLTQLGELLWLTCRTHSSIASSFGFDQQFRPHPSAGAMHPIHIVCQRNICMPWERYDPVEHSLVTIPGTEQLARRARDHAARAVPTANAVLVGLVSEAGKTAAKYEAEQSLVWRDAGVVLGYLSLVAEILKLSFCPLGMTGNAFVEPMCKSGKLSGAALALVGDR